MLVADIAKDLETVLAHALVSVGTRPRLERAAAKDISAGSLHRAGNSIKPFGPFDSTRAGDHRQVAAANLYARHIDDTWLGMSLTAGELVGWQHGNHFGNAGDCLQSSRLQLGLVADDANDRAVSPAAQMGLQTKRLDALHHVIDLFV